jgi:ribosome-binding factor A
MSKRLQQIQATLLRALQEEIGRGLHDPRAGGLITVTGVDVSPDLKNATVLISVLPAAKQDLTMHALRAAAKHLRRRVSDKVSMNEVPELTFRVDESIKKHSEILNAFAKIRQERDESGKPDGAGDADAADEGEAS